MPKRNKGSKINLMRPSGEPEGFLFLIFFISFLLYSSHLNAEDNSSQTDNSDRQNTSFISIIQSQAMVNEQPSENIKLEGETINLIKVNNRRNSIIKAKTVSQKVSQKTSRSGVSLINLTPVVSKAIKKAPTSHWVKRKMSHSAAKDITINQSKELQELQKQREDRTSSFKEALEKNSDTRNSLLLKQ